MTVFHVDGELVPESAATVSVRDRGFQYGDAAFETLRAYAGTIFEWPAHRERLEATCETLGMPGAVPDDLEDRIHDTLDANDLADAYVKVSVTRGVQPGKLTPDEDVDPTVVVIAKSLPRGGVGSDPVWDGPAEIRTVDTRRAPDAAMPSGAKTHNYLGGILARLELRGTDADEALMLDPEGYVAEGATSNVFFVDDGVLKTPSLEGPILPGVTRSVVLDLAEWEGIPVETGTYDPAALCGADEVFLTNTTWEVRPVASVDGAVIGGNARGGSGDCNGDTGGEGGDGNARGGPVTGTLARAFDRRVERLY
jgi:branched-chain amino acid aminotransferase